MSRNFFFAFLVLAVCAGCNPYLTKRINHISRKDKGDSIYVAFPIVETRRESNVTFFKDEDTNVYRTATELTEKALHQLMDNRLPVRFAKLDLIESLKTWRLLDSVLNKFKIAKFKTINLTQPLTYPTKSNLIMIPYFVWTRSTEDYDKGKCGKVGYRDYGNYKYCTWTRSQTYVLVIDRKSKEVIFFKYNQWDIGTIFLPYEYRVTRNFRHCVNPLLRKLGHR